MCMALPLLVNVYNTVSSVNNAVYCKELKKYVIIVPGGAE